MASNPVGAPPARATPAQIDKNLLTIAEPKRLRDKAHLKFAGPHAQNICLPMRTKTIIKQSRAHPKLF
jgi:hypothetical protein